MLLSALMLTLLALLIFLIGGLLYLRVRRLALADPLPPPDSFAVAIDGGAREIADELLSSWMPVGVGTLGRNILLRFLTLLWQCGLERCVGAALLIEPDAQL